MAKYPAELEFDVVLKDGGTARLRPIRPDDSDALDALFQRLSAEAVYQRFFRAKARLTPEELEYFTNVDYEYRNGKINTTGLRLSFDYSLGTNGVFPGGIVVRNGVWSWASDDGGAYELQGTVD